MQRGRRRNLFTRNDMKRAVASAQEAGLPIAPVDINQEGTISVIVGEPSAKGGGDNPWDEILAKKAAKVAKTSEGRRRAANARWQGKREKDDAKSKERAS